MKITIQRFQKGHPLYSNSEITNTNPDKGIIGTFKAIFGQSVTENGDMIDYTMERADTIIPKGIYEFDLYDSPANKCKVIRLTKDPQGNDIKDRKLEHHIANYPYELKGCCAHGKLIDVKTPMLQASGSAFHNLMGLLGEEKTGTITYEDFTIISA